jgi:hypothetical protein
VNWEGPRTATRPIPEALSPSGSPEQPTSKGPHVGGIVGGTVGGVVALVALITIVLLCLRRRKHRAAVPHNQPELETAIKSELDGQQKTGAHYTISEGGTGVSSMASAPAYSPQSSPSHGTNSWNGSQQYYQSSPPHQNGDWNQQPAFSHQHIYYPPPPDPPQSPKYPHEISAELPEVRSPANAELSNVKSPTNAEMPELRSPIPLRGSRNV